MTEVKVLRDYYEKTLAMKPFKKGDIFNYEDDARALELQGKGYVEIVSKQKTKNKVKED